jgi:hypothetical protein
VFNVHSYTTSKQCAAVALSLDPPQRDQHFSDVAQIQFDFENQRGEDLQPPVFQNSSVKIQHLEALLSDAALQIQEAHEDNLLLENIVHSRYKLPDESGNTGEGLTLAHAPPCVNQLLSVERHMQSAIEDADMYRSAVRDAQKSAAEAKALCEEGRSQMMSWLASVTQMIDQRLSLQQQQAEGMFQAAAFCNATVSRAGMLL